MYPHTLKKFLLELSFVKSWMLLVNRGDNCIAKKSVQITHRTEPFGRGHAPRDRQLLRIQLGERSLNIALDHLARQRRWFDDLVARTQAEIGECLPDVQSSLLVNGHIGSQ